MNNLDIMDHIKDQISNMTLEQKVAQMKMIEGKELFIDGVFSEDKAKEHIGENGIGAILDPKLPLHQNVKAINDIQKYLQKTSPYGLPAIMVAECLHGYMGVGATIFPQSICLASSWDEVLIHEVARKIANESSCCGITQGLAPDLDLAREPRWGRVEETYGEDPYLCERLGLAYTNGLQGGESLDEHHIGATIKHFVAHGSPESGINLAPVSVGKRELYTTYLPPFKAVLAQAKPLSAMNAYSELDGVPAAASIDIMTHLLRDECQFDGYVIADFFSIDMLHNFHYVAKDPQEAGIQAAEAGIDIEAAAPSCYDKNLVAAVLEGKIKEEVIDVAVERILLTKYRMNLYAYQEKNLTKALQIMNCEENRSLAQRAAEESIILLENKNDILPLKTDLNAIAVIGPNANQVQLGDYTIEKDGIITPYEAIKNRVSLQTKVYYVEGCGIYQQDTSGFEKAVEIAKKSDVAVLVLGGSSMVNCGIGWNYEAMGHQFKEKFATCGEGFDRTNLRLPGAQQELLETVVATGTPVILVLSNGRPYAVSWASAHVDAMLETWYAGEGGSNALTSILFGDINPSGKLPMTIPKNVGQIPMFYNHKPSAKGFYNEPGTLTKPGRDYVFMDTQPLYPFGYGLSYTTFEYSDLHVDVDKNHDKITIKVKVENTGNRDGKEVVQIFVNDCISSVTTPVKSLKGFKKVHLQVGQQQEVTLQLPLDSLQLLDKNMEWIVEPGEFKVYVDQLVKSFWL